MPIHSNPCDADTDGDGLLDHEEVIYTGYTDPLILYVSSPFSKDSDGDDIYDKYDLEPWIVNESYDRNAVYD